MSKQKDKSGAHEREVAAMFTSAYYPTEDGTFRRVPLSGGWDKRTVSGDIVALKYRDKDRTQLEIDASFPLSVECKNWKPSNVKQFFSGLYSAESQFFEWMKQSIDDVVQANRMVPVVVFKLWKENVVIIQSIDYSRMVEIFGEPEAKRYMVKEILEEGYKNWDLVFLLLKDFLRWIDWGVYKMTDSSRFLRSLIKKEE